MPPPPTPLQSPVPLWGLDPLFHVRVKLLARSLSLLQPAPTNNPAAPRFLSFGPDLAPRPIRLVAVAGIVVAFARTAKMTRFALDDGSGIAYCLVWTTDPNRTVPTPFGLGDFVRVSGRLEIRPGHVPELVVDSARASSDPHAELLWWHEVAEVHRRVYTRPFEPRLADAAALASATATGTAGTGRR